MKYEISKAKSRLDLNFIHDFITRSYWAKGRSKEEMQKCIQHSICYGVYLDDQQIGFARLLSDQVVFAYLMDVFIDKKYRGRGLGGLLMANILEDPDHKDVKRWYLKTKDADVFYKRSGFNWMESGPYFMERLSDT